MKRWLTIFGGILIVVATANAVQIRGKIIETSGASATVKVEGALAPATGDSVEIFFTLPGSGEEVSVAKATVKKVDGDSVQITVHGATGEVETGQLVRINSDNPKKPSAATATATPAKLKPAVKGKTGTKASAPTSTPAQEKKRFAGSWRVVSESPNYTIVLSEHGKLVTGIYSLEGGAIRGEAHGNTLVATWQQGGVTTVRVGGSTTLTLSDDGQTLSGPWNYDAASNAIGYTGASTWTLRRISGSR
ncbi:MAG: hypothetical protein ABR611_14710 [Chthoniobacterales bacterium]